MDAFDADVLIYAAQAEHPLGRRVATLFQVDLSVTAGCGVGSVLLIPETTVKPARQGDVATVQRLWGLLARLDLQPVTLETARLATGLGAKYGLQAADAVHLATAVEMGADRFITNNDKDFTAAIEEIAVIRPSDLDDPVSP